MPEKRQWKQPIDTKEVRPVKSEETDIEEASITISLPLIGTDGQIYEDVTWEAVKYNDPGLGQDDRVKFKQVVDFIAVLQDRFK